MKSLQICGCLLLCVFCLTFVGCDKENKSGGVGIVNSYTIIITNCVADKDPLNVHDKDVVTWIPDVDYQITFLPTSTPGGPKVPTSSNPFQVTAGSTVPQIMRGPSDCSTAGCYYKYSLARIKNGVPEKPPCADPGIRIVPGTGGTSVQ
jgi:hypothetical protein